MFVEKYLVCPENFFGLSGKTFLGTSPPPPPLVNIKAWAYISWSWLPVKLTGLYFLVLVKGKEIVYLPMQGFLVHGLYSTGSPR
jgi:hypothetical protein